MDQRQRRVLIALCYLWGRRQPHQWVHPILLGRQQHGEYHRLVMELRLDGNQFQQYFRLTRELFDDLLMRVGPRITRMDTHLRLAIGPAQHLAICLQ